MLFIDKANKSAILCTQYSRYSLRLNSYSISLDFFKSSFIFISVTLAYTCVVLVLVCPIIRLSVSSEIPPRTCLCRGVCYDSNKNIMNMKVINALLLQVSKIIDTDKTTQEERRLRGEKFNIFFCTCTLVNLTFLLI